VSSAPSSAGPRLRIGLFAPQGLRSLSSIPLYLSRALAVRPEVDLVLHEPGPGYRAPLWKRAGRHVARRVTGRQFLWDKDDDRIRHYSRAIDEWGERCHPDAILLFGSELCGRSISRVPIFGYADSLFGSRIDFYPDQQRSLLSERSVRAARQVQQRGLDRMTCLFMSSSWAVERARAQFDYDGIDDKTAVVGIGANLPFIPEAPRPAPRARSLLWIGVDWRRKGGDFAADVVTELRRRGLEVTLHVVGVPGEAADRPGIRWHGRLDYENDADLESLRALYAESAALLLPSRADLTPIAIAESFAFGRPVIATRVGGIPEMVGDGVTGVLLDTLSVDEWAGALQSALSDGRLGRMAAGCRRAFEESWNWEVVASRIVDGIGARMSRPAVIPPR
jgi:glycosyltransferase involved in cell wall biosynthesis